MSADSGTRLYDWANAVVVAVGAASVQSTALVANEVAVVSDTDCYIKNATNPTASAGATSIFLPAGVIFHFRLSGVKIAAIQKSASGNLFILPVSLNT